VAAAGDHSSWQTNLGGWGVAAAVLLRKKVRHGMIHMLSNMKVGGTTVERRYTRPLDPGGGEFFGHHHILRVNGEGPVGRDCKSLGEGVEKELPCTSFDA